MKEGKKRVKKDNVKMPSQIASVETAEIVPNIPIKKKRGRKKKIKTPEEIEREKNKPKQRRGRKPKSQMIVKRDISEYINKEEKDETIILNLKIDKNVEEQHNRQLQEQFNCNSELKYNPSIAYPTGYDNVDTFTSLPSNILNNSNVINSNLNESNINDSNNLDKSQSVEKKNIYSSLESFIDNPSWKNKTNLLCWWCCHKFDNPPFGIPIKYKKDKFHVSGCFCSLECASSYNFNENNGVQDPWESYSLINLLSQKIGYKDIVKLAPNKVCLKIFGGKLEIDEFRSFTNKNKIINVLDYPMIPSNQQLEEINYNTNNNMNNFIPIDENRLKRIEQKIKLSRNKPLNNNKNTLEHTMNIKISN